MELATKRAIDSYNKDARFRILAMSVAAQVMHDHGPIDPERADREASEIARMVAILMLQRIYDDDAELASMREQRDHYKKVAEQLALLSPVHIPIYTTSPAHNSA